MKKHGRYLPGLLVVGALLVGAVYSLLPRPAAIDDFDSLDRLARIRPDYSDTVIPPNMAPLNFVVREPGSFYRVDIRSWQGENIEVLSRTGKIVIPEGPWRKLLEANRGNPLYFNVYTRDAGGRWNRFSPIANTIAREDVDRYLVYRMIKPLYNWWSKVGIYQRDLQNYDRQAVLRGKSFHEPSPLARGGCVNCHTFCNNRTEKMTLGIRDSTYGSSLLLALDGRVAKVGTKFGYTAWHPSGRLITYSINRVRQFFHEAGVEVRDVVDLDSALAYYLVESQTIRTNPKIDAKDRMETYPTWSPDGRYLYFCSAPILWADRDQTPPKNYQKVRYDLVRIHYGLDGDTWGEPETVLSAEQTGKSILLPRISPDGRFLVFCMSDYGCFPIYQPSSDLYIMDLDAAEQSGQFQYRALRINSDRSES